MRKHFCALALLITVVIASVFVSVDSYAKTPDGKWINRGNLWWFRYSDNEYAKNEYIDGYWMDKDGLYNSAWNGSWTSDATGWWFQSGSWYPTNQWLKIDGVWYYFRADGYMASNEWAGEYYLQKDGTLATDKWIGKYYVGSDGAWVKDQAYPDDFTEAVNKSKENAKEGKQYDMDTFLKYFGFQGTKDGFVKDSMRINPIENEDPKIVELSIDNKYYKIKSTPNAEYGFGKYSLTTNDMMLLYNFIKNQDTDLLEVQNNPYVIWCQKVLLTPTS